MWFSIGNQVGQHLVTPARIVCEGPPCSLGFEQGSNHRLRVPQPEICRNLSHVVDIPRVFDIIDHDDVVGESTLKARPVISDYIGLTSVCEKAA